MVFDSARVVRKPTAAAQQRVSQVGDADSVTLRPGDILVVPTGPAPTLDSAPGPHSDVHTDLPNSYLILDSTGSRLLTLSIRVTGGLAWDPQARHFIGEVLVGLEDSVRRTEQVPLSGTIALQLTSKDAVVDPQTVTIGHTNIPWQRVRVSARDPRDTIHLLIQAVFDPAGYAARIPVARGRLTIQPTAKRIEGFGLEVVKFTVTVPEYLRQDSLTVSLESDRGGLDVATLPIPRSGIAESSLRSRGVGGNTIRVSLGTIATGEASVGYDFPTGFLIAAVLGGLVGAVIRRREKRRGRVDILLGILTGLLCAAAYAIGLNLTGFDINVRVGEAAVLVVSALGAMFNLPGLATLRKNLGGGAVPVEG
jgi:hypothetical protein